MEYRSRSLRKKIKNAKYKSENRNVNKEMGIKK